MHNRQRPTSEKMAFPPPFNARLLLDGEGRIIGSDPNFHSLLGYAEGYCDGWHINKILPLFRLPGDSTEQRGVQEVILPDGNHRMLVVSSQRMGGNHLLSLGENTEREVWRSIMEAAVDSIIIIDHKGVIQDVNASTLSMFGYEKEEMVGRNVNFIVPKEHATRHNEYIGNYHHTGKAKMIGIGRRDFAKRKDGSSLAVHLSVGRFEIGEQTYFVGILNNMSEYEAARQQIIRLNTELEKKVAARTTELADTVRQLTLSNQRLQMEVDERLMAEIALQQHQNELENLLEREKELGLLKSRFVSMASHEFSTPLSIIKSSAELVEKYDRTEDQSKRDKHTSRIQSAVRHLNSILSDFLSLSTLEAGKIAVHPSPHNWETLLRDIMDGMDATLKPGQRIDYSQQGDIGEIHTDHRLLRNILFNLLSNASKYSPQNKHIELKAERSGGWLTISVADNGMGIPKAAREFLFTRFYRAENVQNIKGTGLGLYLVKQYLGLLNGGIHFKSELGRGATFTFKIPIGYRRE